MRGEAATEGSMTEMWVPVKELREPVLKAEAPATMREQMKAVVFMVDRGDRVATAVNRRVHSTALYVADDTSLNSTKVVLYCK